MILIRCGGFIGGAPHDCHKALLPSLCDESFCGMGRPTNALVLASNRYVQISALTVVGAVLRSKISYLQKR